MVVALIVLDMVIKLQKTIQRLDTLQLVIKLVFPKLLAQKTQTLVILLGMTIQLMGLELVLVMKLEDCLLELGTLW